MPDGVDAQVWSDFAALRKAIKAPLTVTALAGIQREADKAGLSLGDALAVCCERGWRGFRADWYARRPEGVAQRAAPAKSFAQQEREFGWARWEQMTGRQHPDRLAYEASCGRVVDAPAITTLEIEQ